MGKKHWIIRLFFVFFTLSVSVAILPCGIINVHGIFGEVIRSTVIEDEEQEVINIRSIRHEEQTEKGINIFNVWFAILMVVVWISFYANLAELPRGDTIVTLKVRMDN